MFTPTNDAIRNALWSLLQNAIRNALSGTIT